ncbi:TRAP transporter small permease [Salinarimonas sp.]|uniref:TRAP transporter small permease n=1 Tax=Salinarimonas sp. TaxID=2766526 RepID=UPI0032D92061
MSDTLSKPRAGRAARMLRALDENGERWLLLVLYGTIVSAISIEVARRFLLSYSSVWGEEVARYAFIYLAWIGASAAVRERAHIRIDVLVSRTPPRVKAAFDVLADLCTLALALICLYWSVRPVVTSLEFGSVTHGLRISMAWFLVAVPLGFALMTFRVLQCLAGDLHRLRTGAAPKAAHSQPIA